MPTMRPFGSAGKPRTSAHHAWGSSALLFALEPEPLWSTAHCERQEGGRCDARCIADPTPKRKAAAGSDRVTERTTHYRLGLLPFGSDPVHNLTFASDPAASYGGRAIIHFQHSICNRARLDLQWRCWLECWGRRMSPLAGRCAGLKGYTR